MLVLSRKLNETIIIDGDIEITVVGFRGNQVRLGIKAPERIGIYREELRNHPRKENGAPIHSLTDGSMFEAPANAAVVAG
jgi:carbon storage regulator